mmetsp:Transcript_25160/g.57198  ORF Transcript_25160/g.57198 Transcript_25160/m.57198 type:complete len:201 (-) Transcript_25160:426-1028(-)
MDLHRLRINECIIRPPPVHDDIFLPPSLRVRSPVQTGQARTHVPQMQLQQKCLGPPPQGGHHGDAPIRLPCSQRLAGLLGGPHKVLVRRGTNGHGGILRGSRHGVRVVGAGPPPEGFGPALHHCELGAVLRHHVVTEHVLEGVKILGQIPKSRIETPVPLQQMPILGRSVLHAPCRNKHGLNTVVHELVDRKRHRICGVI